MMAEAFARAHPAFDQNKFITEAWEKIRREELKGRVAGISQVLAAFLPKNFEDAAPILLRTVRSAKNPEGLSGFSAWPLTQYAADFGINAPETALEALGAITSEMSAEFAIRPFLVQHEKIAFRFLKKWAGHENPHLRRLVSEGTRPRLPWGGRLTKFQKFPEITLTLLRLLRHDPEIYVRKSVANHLNDISKDHPDLLVRELERWKKEFPRNENIDWIIRHACRSLIKSGHSGALALQGFERAHARKPSLRISPAKISLGESVNLAFSAVPSRGERWIIDYAVFHQKAGGKTSKKVFKWARISTERGQKVALRKSHSVRKISTRRYYPGRHEVEILLNGKPAARGKFQLDIEE